MGITSKIKTVLWYLRNPLYHGELLQIIKRRLKGSKKERTREEAIEWCEKNCIATSAAIKKVTGSDISKPIEKRYSEVFKNAMINAEKSPVKMGGPGNIDLLYYLTEFIHATQVIETGVAYGWSSLALLLSLQNRGGQLISTDMPYAKMGNEDYVGCVVPEELKGNWKLIRKPDINGLEDAFGLLDSFDLCHYDSDKSYNGRMWAYPQLWERLKKGGIFVSDDIGDNMAFADFCKAKQLEPIVVKFNQQYVGVLIKQSRSQSLATKDSI